MTWRHHGDETTGSMKELFIFILFISSINFSTTQSVRVTDIPIKPGQTVRFAIWVWEVHGSNFDWDTNTLTEVFHGFPKSLQANGSYNTSIACQFVFHEPSCHSTSYSLLTASQRKHKDVHTNIHTYIHTHTHTHILSTIYIQFFLKRCTSGTYQIARFL